MKREAHDCEICHRKDIHLDQFIELRMRGLRLVDRYDICSRCIYRLFEDLTDEETEMIKLLLIRKEQQTKSGNIYQ